MPAAEQIGVQAARSAFADTPKGRSPPSGERRILADCAWAAMAGFVRHRLEDGTVMVPDTMGRWHALAASDESDILACAFADGPVGRAEVSKGLFLHLRAACIGLWSDPSFLPAVGDCARLPPRPADGGVPIGFEGMAPRFREACGDDRLRQRAHWLQRAELALCPTRTEALRFTLRQSLRWVWLHEAAHLFSGHHLQFGDATRHDLRLARDAEGLDDPARSAPGEPPELALEVHADLVAARLLFRPGVPAAVATLLGALIGLCLFEARDFLRGVYRPTETHPGAWYRALILLAQADRVDPARPDRLRCIAALAERLGHCGQWLGHVLEPAAEEVGAAFRADLLAALKPHTAALRAAGAVPVADSGRVSTDLLAP